MVMDINPFISEETLVSYCDDNVVTTYGDSLDDAKPRAESAS